MSFTITVTDATGTVIAAYTVSIACNATPMPANAVHAAAVKAAGS